MGSNDIALLCKIHPASREKQQKVLDLLRKAAREYYRTPEAQCKTWTYFTPFPPPKDTAPLVLGGLEIYSDKAALQKQIDDPVFFKPYHETVKREGLYSKDEELVAWYLAEGFVAREEHALPFGGGNFISTTKFVGDSEGVLKALRDFVPFVRDKEPDVLTYAAFTRPKAPKEVLLFVRYKDMKALKSHSEAPEHVDAVKELTKHTENDMAKDSSLWQEIDDGFVSNNIGGPSGSKL